MNAEYLGRSLKQCVGAVLQQSAAALGGIMRHHATPGRTVQFLPSRCAASQGSEPYHETSGDLIFKLSARTGQRT
jgi:hypothetical protein